MSTHRTMGRTWPRKSVIPENWVSPTRSSSRARENKGSCWPEFVKKKKKKKKQGRTKGKKRKRCAGAHANCVAKLMTRRTGLRICENGKGPVSSRIVLRIREYSASAKKRVLHEKRSVLLPDCVNSRSQFCVGFRARCGCARRAKAHPYATCDEVT